MTHERRVIRGARKKKRRDNPGFTVFLATLSILGLGALGYYLGLHHTVGLKLRERLTGSSSASDPTTIVDVTAGAPNLLVHGTMAVPVIMYHDVLPQKQVWFDLTTSEFADQMAELSAAHAHPITIQQYYNHFANGSKLPDRPILLTFDDCTLGQYTQALPILEQYHYPAVFFVQTGYVGTTTEKQHMSWQQLREAEATGLITVESHTVTHPEDMTVLTPDRLDEELQQSRATLEAKLGHKVLFLAYPSGTCDAAVSSAARRAGYLAAFTMDRGWTVSPAQSYFMPRFTPKRVNEIINTWNGIVPMAPPPARMLAIDSEAPVTFGTFTNGPFPVMWLAGGDLTTEALDTRQTVGEMALNAKAQAALNGTFFADARIAGTGGAMIGPCLSSVNHVYEKVDPGDNSRIEGRPLILFSKNSCIVFPYTAHLGGSLRVLQQMMPDVEDAFVAGGWIVHYGAALSPAEMARWSSSDYIDPRHRAFVGIDAQNRYILGATQDSINCVQLADMLVRMHIQEAWLLDSGFSTSLIWKNRILVSGHSQPGVPSRPVPHALFLMGTLDPKAPEPPSWALPAAGPGAATLNDALSADSTGGARNYFRTHKRYIRRRHHRHIRTSHETPSQPPAQPPGSSTAQP